MGTVQAELGCSKEYRAKGSTWIPTRKGRVSDCSDAVQRRKVRYAEYVGERHFKRMKRELINVYAEIVIEDDQSPVAVVDPRSVEKKFRDLADEWENETSSVSSVTDMVAHPKYKEIIAMGWPAVPYMLRDLKNGHGFWFTALHEITRIRPFDRRDAGNNKRMVDAWLHWGSMNKIQF
jgi:hypothetical protein